MSHWNESNVVDDLNEFYEHEDKWNFSIGGDKAYPRIDLPEDWHLFVTMTAEEPSNDVNNNKTNDNNKNSNSNSNNKKTNNNTKNKSTGNETINGDEKRHKTPNIAKWRGVVERSIGAIKKWKILENEAYLSRVDGIQLSKLLTVICALVNWERESNKLSW
jgi:hypothetical protein